MGFAYGLVRRKVVIKRLCRVECRDNCSINELVNGFCSEKKKDWISNREYVFSECDMMDKQRD